MGSDGVTWRSHGASHEVTWPRLLESAVDALLRDRPLHDVRGEAVALLLGRLPLDDCAAVGQRPS
eukprot:2313403-Prymnesium_polylepis.1